MARRGVNRCKIKNVEWPIAAQAASDRITNIEIYISHPRCTETRLRNIDTKDPLIAMGFRQPPKQMGANKASSAEYDCRITHDDYFPISRAPSGNSNATFYRLTYS